MEIDLGYFDAWIPNFENRAFYLKMFELLHKITESNV